jgi:hypothetical protein
MVKEEIIKKAAEQGITLDETQAEYCINLSDEELEKLTVSGGAENRNWKPVKEHDALNCNFFAPIGYNPPRLCFRCHHSIDMYGTLIICTHGE